MLFPFYIRNIVQRLAIVRFVVCSAWDIAHAVHFYSFIPKALRCPSGYPFDPCIPTFCSRRHSYRTRKDNNTHIYPYRIVIEGKTGFLFDFFFQFFFVHFCFQMVFFLVFCIYLVVYSGNTFPYRIQNRLQFYICQRDSRTSTT